MLNVAERDKYVLQTFKDYSIPVICSISGGYSSEIKTIKAPLKQVS